MTDELRLHYIESHLKDAIYNIERIGITDKETKDKLLLMVLDVVRAIQDTETIEELED